MIDLNKKYRTRSGKEVKILFTEVDDYYFKVLGVVKEDTGWKEESWTLEGKYNSHSSYNEEYDLIEINEEQELLEEANRKYLNETKFKCLTDTEPIISTKVGQWQTDGNTIFDDNGNWCYHNGKWAEIVKEHTVEVGFYRYKATGNIFVSTSIEPNCIAKKTITFYEGEGL